MDVESKRGDGWKIQGPICARNKNFERTRKVSFETTAVLDNRSNPSLRAVIFPSSFPSPRIEYSVRNDAFGLKRRSNHFPFDWSSELQDPVIFSYLRWHLVILLLTGDLFNYVGEDSRSPRNVLLFALSDNNILIARFCSFYCIVKNFIKDDIEGKN